MADKGKVIHIKPSSQLYYRMALKKFDKMKIEKGITFFQRGISLAKNKDEEIYGQIQLALLYQHDGRFDESICLIDTLIEEVEDAYPDLYYFQAINYMYLENTEDARELVQCFLEKTTGSLYTEEAEEMLMILD